MNGYLQYNPATSTHGRYIQVAINQIKAGKDALADLLATLSQMVISTGGDGSQDADYAIVMTALGAPSTAVAHGIVDELNSLNSKIATDATVDHVNTAIAQACAKLKV
jgi:hypothetical protein